MYMKNSKNRQKSLNKKLKDIDKWEKESHKSFIKDKKKVK